MSMRVAIACSGLGHIYRGIEAWASDLSRSLHAAGVDVRLFQGAPPCEPWAETVPCIKRFGAMAGVVVSPFRHLGGWRYGCGSRYEIEQTSFALSLWMRVRNRYDVLHVQDPWIARHLTRLHRLDVSRPKVIIGNGTGETVAELKSYQYLQHLTPAQLEQWEPHRFAGQQGFLVPYYVNTARFRPGDRTKARQAWGLPEDAFIVLCVGALRPQFKRLDFLIREFRRFSQDFGGPALLVMAGSREAETEGLITYGTEQLGDKVRFLENVPRDRMNTLYPAADVFTLASLNEVFGIAFLEAMACGVPIITHDSPTMRWIAGPAGLCRDLAGDGGMAESLRCMKDDGFRHRFASAARSHVENRFSESTVVEQTLRMYESVIALRD